MSILSFLSTKNKSDKKSMQEASNLLYDFLYNKNNSDEALLELANTIYLLAFLRTNKDFVNPHSIRDVRNYIGNPNGKRLVQYFNVFKSIHVFLSDLPNKLDFGNSRTPQGACDEIIEALVKTATNHINEIE